MGQLPQIRPNPVKILAGAGFGQKRAGCQICRSQSRNPAHPYLTLHTLISCVLCRIWQQILCLWYTMRFQFVLLSNKWSFKNICYIVSHRNWDTVYKCSVHCGQFLFEWLLVRDVCFLYRV